MPPARIELAHRLRNLMQPRHTLCMQAVFRSIALARQMSRQYEPTRRFVLGRGRAGDGRQLDGRADLVTTLRVTLPPQADTDACHLRPASAYEEVPGEVTRRTSNWPNGCLNA